jgi:hypothetical protein
MVLGVDSSRVFVMKVRLRHATEAACQAYANSMDIAWFQDSGELRFKDADRNAIMVFQGAMRGRGAFSATETRKSDGSAEKAVVICRGSAGVRPIIPLGIDYFLNVTATAKTKISTQERSSNSQ